MNLYKTGYNKTLAFSNSQKEQNLYFNYFKKNYTKHLPLNKNCKILDIGCGNGLFLVYLKKLGYKNIIGIDLSVENVKYCQSLGLNVVLKDLKSYLKSNNSKFDLIVLNDVIEHIEKKEVLYTLKLINSSLYKNGKCIIKTHNSSNPLAMNAMFCDFTHEWSYNEKSIKQISALSNYTNVEVFPLYVYPNILILDNIFKWIHMVIAHKNILYYKFNGKKGFKVFTKNMLCILYK